MAYPVNDGAILEYTIQGRMYGQVTLTVLHYRLVDTLGLPDGDAAINSFFNEVEALGDLDQSYALCCSQDWQMETIVGQWIWPTRFHRVVRDLGGVNGLIALPGSPPNVAASITRTSDLAGRRGVGTIHVPGQPSDISANGLIRNTRRPALEALATFLKTKYATDTLHPIIFNRPGPPTSREVTGAVLQNTVRVVRRRTVGLGI